MTHLEKSLPAAVVAENGPWWRGLTRYHWFVFIVASLGWLFDTMDQQLFTQARAPAMAELAPSADQTLYGAYATMIFMMGWAIGGLIFGILGDRMGRAKTMMMTILVYSLFTGLSALSVSVWDFALYRFLTGLGVGGEFAVGVALVAEVMPDRSRPHALAWLQALSAVGNITAAFVGIFFGYLKLEGIITGRPWRFMFLIGVLPAILVLFIMRRLKEPERWRALAVGDEVKKELGSLRELFGNVRWRRHAVIGMLLAFSGVVGLWAIGFYSFDLVRLIFKPALERQYADPSQVEGWLGIWVGLTSVAQNIGGFLGIQAFMWVTHRSTRRLAFLGSFIAAIVSTAFTFLFVGKFLGIYDVMWMIPMMGACQLAMFGGYAIYFPELFPTALRSTGTSFCYNVGRFVAAIGPLTLGLLASQVFGAFEQAERLRYAGVTMCSFFLIGLAVLPFAPETKGQPLPE